MRGLFDVLLVAECGRLVFSEGLGAAEELGLNCCRRGVVRGAMNVRYKGRIAAFWFPEVHLRIARVASMFRSFEQVTMCGNCNEVAVYVFRSPQVYAMGLGSDSDSRTPMLSLSLLNV